MTFISSSNIFSYVRKLECDWPSSYFISPLVVYSPKNSLHPIKTKIPYSINNPSSLFYLLLSFLFFSTLIQKTSATLTTDLLGYYPFDGNANDMSGNGNNGVVYSAVLSSDRFNTANSAYSFNGNNAYIEITNGNAFNFVNQFSISAWIKPASSQVSYSNIFDKSHGSGGWLVEQSASTTNAFYFGEYISTGVPYTCSPVQLISNNWNHFFNNKTRYRY